jgi:hypothetical protein
MYSMILVLVRHLSSKFIRKGIANVVMQVAAQAGCRCYGIEIREDLHQLAQTIKDNFTRRMQKDNIPTGEVILLNVRILVFFR